MKKYSELPQILSFIFGKVNFFNYKISINKGQDIFQILSIRFYLIKNN